MRQMTDTSVDIAKWLGGAAAGALLMYMLDPDRGGARRAQSAAVVRKAGARTSSAVGGTWRGVGERIGAAAAHLRDVRDDVGDKVSDSAASLAAARPDGAVKRGIAAAASALGDGMAGEHGTLTRAGEVVSEGVGKAQDALGRAGSALGDAYASASRSARRNAGMLTDRARAAVQGGAAGQWAPALRHAALAGGGLLALYGLMRRSPLGLAFGLAGAALLARGAANQPLVGMFTSRGLGWSNVGAGLDQTVDFEKTIHIDAAPEAVYDAWTDYENFPHFMSHVVEVRDLGRGRSHWIVKGPGGSEFAWNSRLTEESRPHRLAWRSEAGAEIPQSGSVQFTPHRRGTDVTVRMSYTPPAGALGRGLATLLGADPKARMDEDLARMKAFIERGVAPAAAPRSRPSSRFLH